MLCRLRFYVLARKVLGGYGRGPTAFDGLFGRPGEVGGRASWAEVTECALRLCVCVERGGMTCAWSKRVLVMAMVTERVLPTKQEDCEGVTTMQRAVSLRGFLDIVPLKAETDDLEEDKGYCNLEEIHRGETAPGGLFICPKTRATLGIPLKVDDTSLNHFMVQVITLTSALTNT
jgi:hypothetical protein